MGGSGSGSHYHWWRPAKKTVVEACRLLDANRWMREGILKAGTWLRGGWSWFRDAALTEKTSSIGYEVNTLDLRCPWVRLFYTFTKSQEKVDCRVRLTATQPRFGGLRWWFICPLIVNNRPCNRRVGKLYLPPGARSYGCRHCYRLTYTSSQESRKYDGLVRLLVRDSGLDFATAKRALNSIGRRRL
jgi:hypothetical protein